MSIARHVVLRGLRRFARVRNASTHNRYWTVDDSQIDIDESMVLSDMQDLIAGIDGSYLFSGTWSLSRRRRNRLAHICNGNTSFCSPEGLQSSSRSQEDRLVQELEPNQSDNIFVEDCQVQLSKTVIYCDQEDFLPLENDCNY